ncbi:transposase is4 [Holotrichia oblita]|uniref:Transposase is4 n=1 Tax=Holotrichia oblita TaxID=644536 RepID=A0ACB9T8X9_HOLOL|nr:transposase is4 [Holotrichia oblita]
MPRITANEDLTDEDSGDEDIMSINNLPDAMSVRNLRLTGTILENRLANCELECKAEIKKQARGFFDYRSAKNEIIVAKWHDNNVVTIASDNTSVYPIHQVSRYNRQESKKISVTQSHIIQVYKNNMGGVDRCNQNVALYRTNIRGKKWYFCLISYCLDLMIQIAWQLHKMQNGNLDHL